MAMGTESEHRNPQERLIEMATREPDANHDYYALTLHGDTNGRLYHSMYSHWVGFADQEHRIELREASIIYADRLVKLFREIGERCVIVDTPSDFEVYFLVGGHAVVEATLARTVIDDWLKAEPVVAHGALGFVSVDTLPKTATNRAPTAKMRMEVLKRDGYRCQVCGRRSVDHVDVELHVHHIRPWAVGGLSTPKNLITLCHTCHKGLEPHYEQSLYGLIRESGAYGSLDDHGSAYWEGVRHYVEITRRYIQENRA